jgi:hypothetical protein
MVRELIRNTDKIKVLLAFGAAQPHEKRVFADASLAKTEANGVARTVMGGIFIRISSVKPLLYIKPSPLVHEDWESRMTGASMPILRRA